jgi:hypothetical protein
MIAEGSAQPDPAASWSKSRSLRARLASRWAWAAAARTSAWRTWAAAAFLAGLGTSQPGSSGAAAWESRASRAKWVRA